VVNAVTWHGPADVPVGAVPDPVILNPPAGIVRVTSTAMCGSDLHLCHGYVFRKWVDGCIKVVPSPAA
jgi:threonine dehydrogenase-like Zn-dependent dehydrogenase